MKEFFKDNKVILILILVLGLLLRLQNLNKPEGLLREDAPKQSLTSAQVVKNAPQKNHNAFIVPRVVE